MKNDGGLYLGPVSSTSAARRIIEAVETVVPLRRCTGRPGRTPRSGRCVPAQLGVATCPCAGDISEEDYAAVVATARSGLTDQPGLLLHPLADRMALLAEQERFEEAAEVRDRAGALAAALDRRNRIDDLRRSGLLRLLIDGTSTAEFNDGRLVDTCPLGNQVPRLLTVPPPVRDSEHPLDGPLPKELADELHCVASWLRKDAHRIVVDHCDGVLAESVDRPPTFRAGPDHHLSR